MTLKHSKIQVLFFFSKVIIWQIVYTLEIEEELLLNRWVVHVDVVVCRLIYVQWYAKNKKNKCSLLLSNKNKNKLLVYTELERKNISLYDTMIAKIIYYLKLCLVLIIVKIKSF